jgi:SAM-dependent methyltransferase
MRASYGLDAPGWIAIFAGGAGAALVASLFVAPAFAIALHWMGGTWAFLACWFLVGSLWLKLHYLAPRVLGAARIGKSALVLDLGTGRGLLAIGAAKRLEAGQAVGVDIWSKWDLSGNSFEAAMRNAQIEGVTNRVAFKDADLRSLPYLDDVFDAVVSSSALHNISSPAGRATAIAEAIRVLRPGGRLAICDLAAWRYVPVLQKLGAEDVKLDWSLLPMWGWSALVTARKPARGSYVE